MTGPREGLRGSIALDTELREAVAITIGERGLVVIGNGERFETYTIAGEPG